MKIERVRLVPIVLKNTSKLKENLVKWAVTSFL